MQSSQQLLVEEHLYNSQKEAEDQNDYTTFATHYLHHCGSGCLLLTITDANGCTTISNGCTYYNSNSYCNANTSFCFGGADQLP
jgi:hypothetical protein